MRQIPLKISSNISLVITDYNEDESHLLKIISRLYPNLFKKVINESIKS